jgi:hypothetical protein
MRTARKARLSRMMAKAEQDKLVSSLVTTRRGPSSRNHDHAGKPKPRTRPAIGVVLKMLGRERDDQVAMNGRRRAHNDNQTPFRSRAKAVTPRSSPRDRECPMGLFPLPAMMPPTESPPTDRLHPPRRPVNTGAVGG